MCECFDPVTPEQYGCFNATPNSASTPHVSSDAFLLAGGEPVPPGAKLVGELDLTCHPVHIMIYMAYLGQGVQRPEPPPPNPAAVRSRRSLCPCPLRRGRSNRWWRCAAGPSGNRKTHWQIGRAHV